MYFDYTKVSYMDKNNILYQKEYILMCAFLISYSDDLPLKTMAQPDQKSITNLHVHLSAIT